MSEPGVVQIDLSVKDEDREEQRKRLGAFLRKKRADPVAKIAIDLGVTSGTLYAIENGTRAPSDRMLTDYATRLGLKVEADKVAGHVLLHERESGRLLAEVRGLTVAANPQETRGDPQIAATLRAVWSRTAKQRWGQCFVNLDRERPQWWLVKLSSVPFNTDDVADQAHRMGAGEASKAAMSLRVSLVPIILEADDERGPFSVTMVHRAGQSPVDGVDSDPVKDWFTLAAWAGPPAPSELRVGNCVCGCHAGRTMGADEVRRLIESYLAIHANDESGEAALVGALDILDPRSPIEKRLGRPEYQIEAEGILRDLIAAQTRA